MKKNTKKKNTKNRITLIYISIALVLVLFLAAIFILPNFFEFESKDKYNYNGFSFFRQGGFWYTQGTITTQEGAKEFILESRFGPRELESLDIDRGVNNFFKDTDNKSISAVYLTFDLKENNSPYLTLAAADLNVLRALGVSIYPACTSNETEVCQQDMPIINCADKFPVIYLKESETEKISYTAHRCVIIEGKGEGLVKSVDRILFQWYGIMY